MLLRGALFYCILGLMSRHRTIPRIQLLRMKAVLRDNHGGPGPHKSGSPQTVHGDPGSGDAGKSRKIARVTWWDLDGKTHTADVLKIEKFKSDPGLGTGALAISGKNRGEVLFVRDDSYGEVPTHGEMIRAVHPHETVDNYVRFYFTSKGVHFGTAYAGVSDDLAFVDYDSWRVKSLNNIYKAMDRLVVHGLPQNFRVVIEDDSNLINTTLKSNHGGPGPHKDGSSQDVHGGGRSAAPGASGGNTGRLGDVHSDARRTFDMLAKAGGFTYQAVADFSPTDGFMVSPYQDREEVIPQASLSYVDIAEFLVENKDLLQQDDHYLGGWAYEGKVYLDVSIRAGSESDAREISKKHQQIAFYDLAGQREVIANAKGVPLSYLRAPDDSLASFSAWLRVIGSSLGLKGRVPDVLAERYWRKFQEGSAKQNRSLWAHHGGPGPHKDGSSQDVHGKKGAGSASTTSTPGKAKPKKKTGSGRAIGERVSEATWQDMNGDLQRADVFRIREFSDVPDHGMGALAIRGLREGYILYTPSGDENAGSLSHGRMIRSAYPGEDWESDYVRFYFSPKGIEFNATSAAQEVAGSDWADKAFDNIYNSLDRLAAAGVPPDTPVRIKRGITWFETTVK